MFSKGIDYDAGSSCVILNLILYIHFMNVQNTGRTWYIMVGISPAKQLKWTIQLGLLGISLFLINLLFVKWYWIIMVYCSVSQYHTCPTRFSNWSGDQFLESWFHVWSFVLSIFENALFSMAHKLILWLFIFLNISFVLILWCGMHSLCSPGLF